MSDESSSNSPAVPAKSALPARKTGLSPKQQKLQALLDKAQAKGGAPAATGSSQGSFKAKSSFAGKKTAFQRKAT